jgi:tRNA threonylcarbamoyladenosine biosynthesis protein TsaE
MLSYSLSLKSLADTENLAKAIALSIVPNFVLTLNGDLGSGKTTLTRNILQSMGISGSIKSPTYTLVEPYKLANFYVYHFDLYRFSEPEEWFESGFDEYFINHSICFIEWAEKALELIPVIDWQIDLTVKNEMRIVKIISKTKQGNECLTTLIKHDAIF